MGFRQLVPQLVCLVAELAGERCPLPHLSSTAGKISGPGMMITEELVISLISCKTCESGPATCLGSRVGLALVVRLNGKLALKV